ncbi:MAG: MgtC/SapB family protein [Deltaproteobacteria bacterium]|nr:MgtC/SapB family protein [Deltaproteobacteria bacterium]
MEPYERELGLATALAVGLLVGLEREQSRGDRPGASFAGVRTYPIFALVGALSTLLDVASSWLPLVSLLGVFALVAISYAHDVRTRDDHGATTEISVIATYLLGALATSKGVVEPMQQRLLLVGGLGVAITFLLSSKPWFHRFAARVSRDDFYATVKFLIVAVVVLPQLPNRDLGPLDAINPRSLGLMVVTISGLSFLGYVAMHVLGTRRGLLVGAALGGLVSSTAATLSFANRTKQTPELAPVAAGAVALAWLVMLARVGVLVAIIAPSLLTTLAGPLAGMIAGTLLGFAVTFQRDGAGEHGPMELTNPFELGSAIKVSAVFGAVLLATKAATVYTGDGGLYLASALGGTTDVDAVTLSTAKLAQSDISAPTAAAAIAIAIAVNTMVKLALAAGVGGWVLGRRVAVTAGFLAAGGAVGLAVVAL